LGSESDISCTLTSAYIVRRAAGNWVDYKIPEIFTTSTILIFL